MTDLTPKMKRCLKRIAKREMPPQRTDWLEIRVLLKERIEEVAVDGVIGIDWDKTDCDMARWGGHSVIPATVTHFIAWENDFYENAEGPQGGWLVKPRDDTGIQYHRYRDLALEAFENGHPHIVYR